MPDRIAVLHLRASSGSGGGPEKTILKTGQLINAHKFLYLIAYLKKKDADLSPVSQRSKKEGLSYFEFSGRRFIDPTQLWEIARLIRKYGVHILHCHDPKTDFYGVLLRTLFPKLIIASTMHGWIKRTRKSAFYIILDIWLLRRFHAVITVSKNLEQTAKDYGIVRTYLIYNAIDTDEWQPTYPSDPAIFTPKDPRSFIVGYTGRISKEKGPFNFIRVANRILQQDKHCEFVVAGEGPQLEAMQKLAEQMGIMQQFHFLGHVEGFSMYSLYQKFDLLISTSSTEGLPNNLLEACAMFVPVIATKVGGVGELIENGYNGFLTEDGDIEALAQQALTLKKNQELAEKFRRNAREVVERKFSLSESVHRLEEVYEELFRGQGN